MKTPADIAANAVARAIISAKAEKRMIDGYNLLRDALSWFDAHEVEKKLGHLPQWVPMARDLIDGPGRPVPPHRTGR